MGNDVEREQIECVFSLGGGELHRKDDRFPDEWDGVFAYWYDGAPYHAAAYTGDWDSVYRTAILCEVYGRAPTPAGWKRVDSFRSCGEAECTWQGAEDLPGSVEVCPLCGTPISVGDGGLRFHPLDGYVYIGEEWSEVVYKATEEGEE